MKPRRAMKVETSDELAGVLDEMGLSLRYDLRANRLWHDGTDRPLTDRDFDLIIDEAMCQGFKVPTMRTDMGKRVWNAYFAKHSFDPFVDWLEDVADRYPDPQVWPHAIPELLWPGRTSERCAELECWSWGALFLAIVARAYAPPVRWDIVPIIAGPQGCGKSTAVTNMLPTQWTNGGFPLRGIKDFDSARKTVEFTEGKVLLESSEMVGMNANTREPVKAFLTSAIDRATRKYAVQAEDIPRRWAIVGTTNDVHPVPYDPSGGRRWIVTRVKGTEPDDGRRIAELLHDVRAEMWATSVHDYRSLLARHGGAFPQTVLSVPDHLQTLHKAHVEAHMWTPPKL